MAREQACGVVEARERCAYAREQLEVAQLPTSPPLPLRNSRCGLVVPCWLRSPRRMRCAAYGWGVALVDKGIATRSHSFARSSQMVGHLSGTSTTRWA